MEPEKNIPQKRKRPIYWKSSDLEWRLGFSLLAVIGVFLSAYIRLTRDRSLAFHSEMPAWAWNAGVGLIAFLLSVLVSKLPKFVCALMAVLSIAIAIYHALNF